MAQNSDEVLHDLAPRLKHYKDGRIQRLRGEETVPPSLDPATGVQSKDVHISPELPLSARLYLPPTAAKNNLLLLIYYHGGAFVTYSAFSIEYQKHLNLLVARANVVAVSVNYRRAPESPLPAALEDAWHALAWTASENSDEWIKQHADLGRVYLGGDSAGGNLAHNVAVRFGSEKLDGIKLAGMFLNCPFFWGQDRIGREADAQFIAESETVERLVKYICPGLTGFDEPWMNPGKDPRVAEMACGRVLVYVAEKDHLRDRGWEYAAALGRSGWGGEVEVVEVKGEVHVFSVLCPEGENGLAMINRVAAFINSKSEV